jgi:threonine synthase
MLRLAPGLHVLELFHGPDARLQGLRPAAPRQPLRAGSARSGARRSTSSGPPRATRAPRPSTGSWASRAPPSSSFIPDGRVSPLQERQMACTGAANVFALAVDGSFDDAQAVLKEIFGTRRSASRHRLSAVNSINIARVLAQSVYYLHAWLRLPEGGAGGRRVRRPDGQFRQRARGLDAPADGGADPRVQGGDEPERHPPPPVHDGRVPGRGGEPSLAPSMDIQVASNFERFLYYSLGRDAQRVRAVMAEIRPEGRLPLRGFRPRTRSPRRGARTPRSPASSGRSTGLRLHRRPPHGLRLQGPRPLAAERRPRDGQSRRSSRTRSARRSGSSRPTRRSRPSRAAPRAPQDCG